MKTRPDVVVCTQDPELLHRIAACLRSRGGAHPVDNADDLLRILDRMRHAVVLLDLRHRDCAQYLSEWVADWPGCALIALGHPRSDPMIEAESLGLYACESLDVDRAHLRALVDRASDHVESWVENEILREDAAHSVARAQAAPTYSRASERLPLRLQMRQFSHALRKMEKLEALFEAVVENVAATAGVSRVGLFCRTRDTDLYRLRASLRCIEDSARLEFTPRDPLVRWLTLNDHIVARSTLEHIRAPAERQLLRHALDSMGAEALLPLHARGQVLGWLFIGHRGSGIPFEPNDLEDLTALADHVSTVLENALLYEEVAVQKTLAETLLHTMPTGIVAVGLNGVVRWFNSAAQHILDMSPNKVLNNPIRLLGSRLADVLQRALDGAPVEKPAEWTDALTKRHLSVQTHRLMSGDSCLGAVALIQDLTLEKLLEEKREQLERAAFWTELAASMSHEIRNPLVAIKTFAQLLPERYDDAEFRADFSRHVTAEVERLNGIIEQINEFAHPPAIKLEPVQINNAVARGIKLAQTRHAPNGTVIDAWLPDDLPPILGDERALAECVSHLMVNALEATEGRHGGRVEVSAKRLTNGDFKRGILLTIRDNGRGLPEDAGDKVFSPFFTTKARGMGLGLPIVKRTVVDHNGRLHIEPNPQGGTAVSVLLPAATILEKQETPHEAHIGR